MMLKRWLCVQVLLLACSAGTNGYGGVGGGLERIPTWLRSKRSSLEARQVQQWLGDPSLDKAASTDLCKKAGLLWCEAWQDGGARVKPQEQALILPPCDTSCNGSGRVVPSELELFFLPSLLQQRGNAPLMVPNLLNAVPSSKFLPDPIATDLLSPILKRNWPPLDRRNTTLDAQDPAFKRLLSRLGISPTSTMAHAMLSSLLICVAANEDNQLNIGTYSFCAPSLESMIHFSLAITNTSFFSFQVLSSDPISPSRATSYEHTGNNEDASQDENLLRILDVHQGYNASVVCHKLIFAFEFHWCHQLPHTTIYEVDLQRSTRVSMSTEERALVHAIVACHLDTSTWPPYHPALRKLQLQPGKASPVCHWIPNDTPIWVSAS
ncbi:hypothetical protein L7F22_045964 [Adiantum nelumboides]|nr:hypothetical protein [Adiantum nelumboides]